MPLSLYEISVYADYPTELSHLILSFSLCSDLDFCVCFILHCVTFIHGCGVLHRDLKPHNLLMDWRTRALKVVNLGLSRAFTISLKRYIHEVWSGI
jgi:serine/threonine protein kinase